MKKIFIAVLLNVAGAAGAAPLPEEIVAALAAVQTYDYGQPRQPLFAVEAFAGRATAEPAQREALAAALARMLQAPAATTAARSFALRELALVGGEAEMPALAALLDKPEQGDEARRALQAIPLPAAIAVLREALPRLKDKARIGVIHSLGERRDAESIGAIKELLRSPDAPTAAAAAWALGMIGTPDAAAALPVGATEARLLCAERAGGRTAKDIYAGLCGAPDPAARLAGLAGLARLDPQTALPELLKAAREEDPVLGAGALQLAGRLAGDAVNAALVAELPKFDAARQVVLLAILAERRASAARGAVAELAGGTNEDVRAAALTALGSLGDATALPLLMKAAAEGIGATGAAAEGALAKLAAPGVDEALVKAIAAGAPGGRVSAINAAVARAQTSSTPALFAALRDADDTVRAAAARALGKIGGAVAYPQLVALLGEVQGAELEGAIAAVGRRVGDANARLAPLLALLQRDGAPAAAQAAALRTLGGIGGHEALAAVRQRLAAGDAALREAAVRTLCDWPDAAALQDLEALVNASTNRTHKALAMRGMFRLAPAADGGARWFARVQDAMRTADEKRLWVFALGTVHTLDALTLAKGLLKDPDVKGEAALAMAQIGGALAATAPDRVLEDMSAVLAVVPDSAAAKAARAEAQQALSVKSEHSAARRQALAAGLPAGAQIAAYLDCGVERQDKSKDGVALRVGHGQSWAWHGAAENPAALTVAYAAGRIDFEAAGLNPQKHYQVGFTWWDYDANGREQSVWIGGKQVLGKTALPAWQGRQQGPAQLAVAVPDDAIRKGRTTIEFRGEGAGNTVCAELWLVESDAALPPPPVAAVAAAPAAPASAPGPVAAPQVRANAGAAKKILIVTGRDYPGHKWPLTTPVLVAALSADKRLEVSVVEDARFLASPELKKWDAVVLHYMNWQDPGPGAAAQENLRACVEQGTGLVLVHFACGAFQGWPEFVKLAGRAWDPKLRGHDPIGTFRVVFGDAAHPVAAGLEPFETKDELYTCLAGETPIRVLASAKSKVDGKDYPMAFVLDYGKGRVFHSVLGHDAPSLENPPVGRLYRRGTAWAAGLEP